jgi:hypothetical protein
MRGPLLRTPGLLLVCGAGHVDAADRPPPEREAGPDEVVPRRRVDPCEAPALDRERLVDDEPDTGEPFRPVRRVVQVDVVVAALARLPVRE